MKNILEFMLNILQFNVSKVILLNITILDYQYSGFITIMTKEYKEFNIFFEPIHYIWAMINLNIKHRMQSTVANMWKLQCTILCKKGCNELSIVMFLI